MKWMKFLLTVVAVTLGSAAFAAETLDPAEATPGRKGVCITEMDGGERVEIPLTVLGTVGSGTPDGKIVLVRLEHPRFEETGIIAGMSGSPVYVDGKLLGALAYGWPFASEPIGGVTPFARMVEMSSSPSASGMSARPSFNEIMVAARNGGLGNLVVDWLLPEKTLEVRPLPLVVAGWRAPSAGGWLAESWRRMGWVAASGSSQLAAGVTGEVVPGSMVAAVMVDGDVTLAAGGTVTEVRDDHLWAFGHPSLGVGSTTMPLSRASVVAVLPSVMSSSKFITVGEPIGAIVADRRDGILGRLGADAPMVPISVTVNGRSYSYRAARHPTLMPLLAGYLANASLAVDGRTFGDQTVATRVSAHYPGEDTASVAATYASSQASVESSAFAAAVVAYLEGSSFEKPDVDSIDIVLDSVERLEVATILDIVPERRVVRPGEKLAVRFRLRPRRGPEQTRTVTVQIPAEMPEGRVDLIGADGAAWTVYDLRMRPLLPASFSDEVRLVNSVDPSSTIVAVLERRDSGMVMPGGTISAPPSVVFQLQSALGPNLDTVAYGVFAKVEAEMPFPVSGAQRIPLTVRAGSLRSETR
jgi:hypothetical protein